MWSIAIGLGISKRDSWHVSEDMSANISLEVAVTNGFSYLRCINGHAGGGYQPRRSTMEIQDNLHYEGYKISPIIGDAPESMAHLRWVHKNVL